MIWNGSLEPMCFFIIQTQDKIATAMGMKKKASQCIHISLISRKLPRTDHIF